MNRSYELQKTMLNGYSRGHKWLTMFFVSRFLLVAIIQNKRHGGIHFASLSIVGIINDDNIRCIAENW